MSVQTQFLELDGFRWHLHHQPGQGIPIFFVHGFLDSGASFYELMSHFTHPCWAWDARGFGQSDWLKAPGYYHFYDYLYDLNWVLEALGLDKVILVGHSMGGMIASLYAGAFPDQVAALVNLEGWFVPDSPVDTIPERVRLWIKQRKAMPSFSHYASQTEAAERLKQRDPKLTPKQADYLSQAHSLPSQKGVQWRHDPLHKTRSPQPFRLDQAQAFWKKITAPTLLAYGKESQARNYPDWQSRTALFPQATLKAIPQAGHNLHLHQSKLLASTIKKFLATSPGP